MTLCVKVRKEEAEKTRQKLLEKDALDLSKKIKGRGGFILFPLKKKVAGYTIQDKVFEQKEAKPRSLKECLEKELTKEEIDILKTAYDSFGEIAVLEIPEGLKLKEKAIGSALLKLSPSLRAVFKKGSPVEGEYRVRALKKLVGVGGSETTYKEHGCTYKFDLSKVFFTPRLSTERLRIAEQVKPDEVVMDLFAGVGPFSILIAKKQPLVKKIYASDLNPAAFEYLKKNIKINKVSDKVVPLLGDAEEIAKERKNEADRVIMNLPRTTKNYLPTALSCVKKDGIVHYYTFAANEEEVKEEIKNNIGVAEYEVLHVQQVRTYSPSEWNYAADIHIENRAFR